MLLVVAVVAAAVVIGSNAASDDGVVSVDRGPDDAEVAPGGAGDVTGAADEVDDVGPCRWIDDETVELDITNNSSEQSSYVIDINFLDAAGDRVGDEPFFVNYVRPGERAVEESFIFDSAGGVDCEIAEVERFAAPSPHDVDEVTCETNGLDFADDIATTFRASNGSSETSDYFVTAALVRDGIRVGTAFASIENVRPDESAPGDGFSVVDGPDVGVSCEVVHVSRTSSE